ncbi:hypothetical protein [Arthrobacter sp. EpRS71]|uniref:hypothetical protein n=1 Tax=Arthrobacter sp. EpRS71 TaxID=1743141 RepID=UPI0007476BD8|nr:hypothetical protein [Arthrobacter sp. EpRS71]KUM35543.1 hypothetical protein AR689_16135 [Arthrobacter sp. EpRS71]
MSPARLSRTSGSSRSRRRPLVLWIGALVAAAILAATGVSLLPSSQQAPPPVAPAALPQYPLSGYFIYASTSATANREKLADIRRLGGDTLITFGTLLRPASRSSLPQDCLIDGNNCADVVTGSLKVNRYFTYSDGAQWSGSALGCPRDRSLTSNGKTFAVLVFPTDSQGCNSPSGTYDVVVTGGTKSTDSDPTQTLAAAATELKMEFYAGLPAPVKRTDLEYLPDLSYTQTLSLFTERFLRFQAEKNDVPGLAGFYHHVEMPLSSSPIFDPILSLYTLQNQSIHKLLPSRSAVISPYIESRKSTSFVTPADARVAIRNIAETSTGLKLNIAIQDGMGTGKGAAYVDSEAKTPVDPYAATIVGNGSWQEKYAAPNQDYFRAAAAGIKGTNAVLWANLEGMAPATDKNFCSNSLRGQTTLERIERQLQQMEPASKVISFMWDPYFTCKGTGTPLMEQMASGFKTPVVTSAAVDRSSDRLTVTGFNIAGGQTTLKWTSKDGRPREWTTQSPGAARNDGKDPGANSPLESLEVDLKEANFDAGTHLKVDVTNQWGASLKQEFAEGLIAP